MTSFCVEYGQINRALRSGPRRRLGDQINAPHDFNQQTSSAGL